MKSISVYIGIGSNLGDPLANCRLAIRSLISESGIRIVAVSPFYRTEPVGKKDQHWFVNAVVGGETSLNPRELLQLLQEIEAGMGRVRKERWGPRIIDLDLLCYGDQIVQEENLTIPHPHLHERRFVLVPLNDIAPDLRHPLLNRTVSQVLTELPEDAQVLLLREADQKSCGESS